MLSRLRAVFAFMTRMPVPIQEGDFDTLPETAPLFPLVGLVIGGVMYGIAAGSRAIGIESAGLRMVLLLMGYYLLCGGIHLDGVADFWDGMNCGGTKEKIFQAMSDSNVGSFGVLGLIFIVGLAGMGVYHASALSLLLFPIVGRAMGLLIISIHSPAKKTGLGKPMIDNCGRGTGGFALVVLAVIAWILPESLVAYGGIILLYLVKLRPFLKRIGGITGDGIGFTIETTQWLFLLFVQGGFLL